MTRRDRQPTSPAAPSRRTVILTAILSVVAAAVAVGVLAVVLIRGTDSGQAGQADPNACRTVAWSALPDVADLPSGWTIASSRFLVGILTTTLVGPTPSGSTQGPAVFVSVSCYGTDAQLALARDHEAALGAGATDVTSPKLGDESLAVTSTRAGSTTVYVRRGTLVADVTASTSLDQAVLQSVASAVDRAMLLALSATPRPSSTAAPAASSGASPAPPASITPSASSTASQSPAPVSHLAPDLEALLPPAVDGTTLATQSATGTTALKAGVTSQALTASLTALGKTPADLEIGAALDPTRKLALYLYAFRVKGVDAAALSSAIVGSWLANTSSSPSQTEVTLGGRKVTKVVYSQGPADYVFESNGVVYDIETTDESLAMRVLGLLK